MQLQPELNAKFIQNINIYCNITDHLTATTSTSINMFIWKIIIVNLCSLV